MPIYEFYCPDCQKDFEELVFNSREKVSCPHCGGGECEKLMSAVSFRSKGSGGETSSSSAGSSCSGCAATSCGTCAH